METQEQRIIFMKGKKVVLRPIDKEKDLEFFVKWFNDLEITQYMKAYLPMMKENEEKWIEDAINNRNNVLFMIETHDGHTIGEIAIHNINWHDRHAETGTVIGEKDYWGKGYGTDAKMLVLDYAFNTLNLFKICSGAVAYNQRSINYSLKCGYKIEGKRRKHFFRKGEYQDLIVLGIFKKEWERAYEIYKNT